MHRFRVNRFTIKPVFFIIVAVMLLVLPIYWVVGWLAAILLHELGHMGALLLLRRPIYAVVLDCNGVYIKTDLLDAGAEILCALAGPVIGITPVILARYCPYMAVCAFTLSCFNMVPLLPLDGGRVISGLARLVFDPETAFAVTELVGVATLLALSVGLCILAVKFHNFLPMVLALVFVLVKAYRKNTLQTGETNSTIVKNVRGTKKHERIIAKDSP